MHTRIYPLALLFALAFTPPSHADDYNWSVPSGDWSIPSNWGGTLPTGSDDAIVNNAATATISQNGATAHDLILGTDSASPGSLQITGGSLNIGGYYIGNNGPGSVTQSAGSVTVGYLCWVGYLGNGSYSLSGSASLNVGGWGEILAYGQLLGFNTGSHGTFNQSGGANTTTTVWIPSGSSYTLSGGTLNINGCLQNSGAFDFANGNASLNIAPNSLVNIADGSLLNAQNASLTLGANAFLIVSPSFNPATTFGSFTNGGIIHVQGTPITLTPGQSINGGGNINDFVTCNGGSITHGDEQTLNLYGGFCLSSGFLSVSDIQSNNPAQMSGGALQANYHFVQTNFTQTGGSASYNALYVGNNDIAGTFSLRDGSLTTAAGVWIGYDGGGTFNISGGMYTGAIFASSSGYACVVNQSGGAVSSTTFGLEFGSACTYNFTGGTIVTNEITNDDGAIFNFGGGSLKPSTAFGTSVPMTLTAINGNANIDTAGYNLTLSGILSGPGGLNKLGPGTLILAANNAYRGATNIESGTLTLASAASISASSTIHIASGVNLDVSAQPNFSLAPNQTLTGAGTLIGSLIAPATSHIAPGDSAPGTLTITGNVTLNASALLDFDLAASGASDKISVPSSTLMLNDLDLTDFNFTTLPGFAPGTYTLIDAGTLTGFLGPTLTSTLNGYPITLSTSNNDLLLTVSAPEPASLSLLAIGATILAFRRRKPQPPHHPRTAPRNQISHQ